MTTATETATCQCCGREWQRPPKEPTQRCFECRMLGCTYTYVDGWRRVYVHKEEHL